MKAPATLNPQPNALGQAITASTVGNVLEWFDFAVYGYVAPYIGPLFFPSQDPVASTIAAFAVFAVGYLARPLGPLVLGWVGDRVGRRIMLVISVTILGASSCAIGLQRTHQTIGNCAHKRARCQNLSEAVRRVVHNSTSQAKGKDIS